MPRRWSSLNVCRARSGSTGVCFFPYFIATPAECLFPLRLASPLGEFSGLSCATPDLQKLRQARALQQDVPFVGGFGVCTGW
ncbi:hypothetical protein MRX96_059908 [Rhipicephalus microplus]